jgi:hypothetical protein
VNDKAEFNHAIKDRIMFLKVNVKDNGTLSPLMVE